jgi:WhiB family redox-sensing transcriptional regulator
MWQFEAQCKTEDSNLFFSELASKVARAKMICSICPVKKQCLDFAISNNIEEGIFGGLTFDERKSLVLA